MKCQNLVTEQTRQWRPCAGLKKIVAEDEYHLRITEDRVPNPWLIRHSAWVYSRHQRRESGQTAFEELKGLAYIRELVPFGDTVAGHSRQKHRTKMASDLPLDIWVGRTGTSNEHILLTRGGVLRCRSVRRLKVEERHDKEVMESAKGLPWDQKPPRDPADELPREVREPPQRTLGQPDEQPVDRRPGAELAQFNASHGQTPGCQGMSWRTTSISPDSGLQGSTTSVARATRG